MQGMVRRWTGWCVAQFWHRYWFPDSSSASTSGRIHMTLATSVQCSTRRILESPKRRPRATTCTTTARYPTNQARGYPVALVLAKITLVRSIPRLESSSAVRHRRLTCSRHRYVYCLVYPIRSYRREQNSRSEDRPCQADMGRYRSLHNGRCVCLTCLHKALVC